MNLGSIDIGSNTVLLLVAEINDGKLTPICNEFRSPRLSKGLKKDGEILEDRIIHLINILREYKSICEQYKCEKVILTATNAMRIASNATNIIERVKSELGFIIGVIPGDEEAKLSYLGASSSFNNFEEKTVIDIGGGSTEIIYGNSNEIKYKKSFPIGVVSLTEAYLNKFPYAQEAISNAQKSLKNTFNKLNYLIPASKPMIAVAGTPTTLSCIIQNIKTYEDSKVEGSLLTQNNLKSLYDKLSSIPGDVIKQKYGHVVEGREDILFAGLLILDHVRELLNTDIIHVSSRGLRYGNIINYI